MASIGMHDPTERWIYRAKDTDAIGLADELRTTTTLKTASLRGELFEGGITDTGAAHIADALRKNETLTSLSMAHHSITEAGVVSITKALKENKTLTSVSLDGIPITDIVCDSIAETLGENKTMTSFELGGNFTADVGAVSIAEALQKNETLKSLSLSAPRISIVEQEGPEGTEYSRVMRSDHVVSIITHVIRNNTTLETISLTQNEIDDDGANSIARSLETNTTLKNLDLSHNMISKVGAESILKAFERSPSMESVELKGDSHINYTEGVELMAKKQEIEAIKLHNRGQKFHSLFSTLYYKIIGD